MNSRRASRRAAVRTLFQAFPGRTSLLAGLALLDGGLPAVFAALVGVLVGSLPAAVTGGFGSAGGHRVVITLVWIGVVLVLQELVASAKAITSNDLYRRFDAHLLGAIMAAAMDWPDLDLFDDPEKAAALDRARKMAAYGPGELVSGLSVKWEIQARGGASAILLAYFFPYVAVPLAVLWVLVGRALQASYYRANPFWSEPLRRAGYLKRLGTMPEWAKELRIFGLVEWIAERFAGEWRQVMAELQRARRADHRVMAAWTAALLVGNAAATALVVRSAWAGSLGIGGLAVAAQAIFGMAMLASLTGDIWIENGAVPVPEVHALQAMVADRPIDAGRRSADALPVRSIRFEHLSFTYPGRTEPVYDDFDLEIAAGTSLAIVGLNGAGKTTLVKLLTGLCHPQRGRITVDGTDLTDLNAGSWRRAVGAIFQDFVHYELPARDNVGFGAVEGLRDAGVDDRVRSAIRGAGAKALVEGLPGGLDTVLSRRFDGGVDLSGGQWQRIALARALLAVEGGARVLVLDEPTAHLDVRAEADLFDRFLDLTRGLTTVLISHRFSTVRRADRIVVLDGGRVVEDGDHAELVAADGRYAHMFRLQADRYVGDRDD